MKKNKLSIVILGLLLLLAAYLRLYKLAQNPPSLYWDEVSLGYNAFAILTTGHDEHGEFLPLARFIAFGDYKPPGYIYSAAISMLIFGVNEFAVRLPSAISGVLMVLFTYLLMMRLFQNKYSALIGTGLLAISPWSIQLSRAAFEAHLAALFNLIAIYAFTYTPKKPWMFVISVIFWMLAFYTFNANRVLCPLFLILLSGLYFKTLLRQKKWVILGLVIAGLFLLPSIDYLRSRESRLRFQEVSIFTSLNTVKKANDRIARDGNTVFAKLFNNRRLYFVQDFLIHYTDNFKGEFLFITGDANPRLSTQDIGHLYVFEAPFLLIGLIYLLYRRDYVSGLIIGWMLIAPIPAGTARETPHMLRAATILPTFHIVSGLGMWIFLRYVFLQKAWIRNSVLVLGIAIVVSSFIYHQHYYWVHYPLRWASEWQNGYKEMVEHVKLVEKDHDKIVVTNYLGRPYIYFLFYNKINPIDYKNSRRAERDWYGLWNVYGFAKYEFVDYTPKPGEKTLKVGQPGTFGSDKQKTEIKAVDGRTVFEIAPI